MFTVVVPTMWKYPPFLDFVQDLSRFHLVSDIIIINNNSSRTPLHPVLSHPKVRIFDFGNNIYVNPAFNLGVAESKNDKICLLNDDLIFDPRIFYRVDEVLNESSGVVGICPGLDEFKQAPFTSGSIKIIPWTPGQHTFGFGCLMFVHRTWYEYIPGSFRLYYGDNWIFDTCLARGRTNYLITDALFHTPYATTCKDMEDAAQLLDQETSSFNQAIWEYWQKGALQK